MAFNGDGVRLESRYAADTTHDGLHIGLQHAASHPAQLDFYVENNMKILLWFLAIIFIIGLLVVFGVFSLIF